MGGSVVFAASRAVRSLGSLNNSYKAGVGGKGSGDNCHGKRGKDVSIEVRVDTATTLLCKLLCGQRSLQSRTCPKQTMCKALCYDSNTAWSKWPQCLSQMTMPSRLKWPHCPCLNHYTVLVKMATLSLSKSLHCPGQNGHVISVKMTLSWSNAGNPCFYQLCK